ncbi:leucine-rich repeat domain-containing protein [Dysgonomonas macrotermitis]|uniref:Leucine rich repeat-containing protein n=1 Tax=Dysgonomonas macrotermitis TaxID=1346286 RepID=A0A1M5HI08_9BACT|nr:leucine-rich repeat domain-containing protein [Dysgonomonas macrotermitis]SHG15590.1 Leucine rich repeat-containing protein [Dysgonomonas macrotermitis]
MKKIVFVFLSLLPLISSVGQNTRTLTLTKPGTLSMKLSYNEQEDTTDLTLIGTMNAKDFNLISANMPNLRTLNLKDVVIEEFIGSPGPQIISDLYEGNKIPAKSLKYKKYLVRVVLPQNLTSIGEEAFAGCTSLTDIELPGSLLEIERAAFEGCLALKSIEIPASVEVIEDETFNLCSNLSDVKLNEGLLSIGKQAFGNCFSLKKIAIPDTVSTLDKLAFVNCKNLKP